MTSNKVKVVGWLAMLVGLASIVEFLSFVTLSGVNLFSSYIYMRPIVTDADISSYMESRDKLLGWPTKQWLTKQADRNGARLSPANDKLAGKSVCVSVFGDSFAFSDEVDQESAWANQLASMLDCRVNNFGVSGYGTDQAVLRYEYLLRNNADIGQTVILTLYPDDLNRNVNQWRYLLGSDPFAFKPAFKKRGNKFVLLDVPVNGANDLSTIYQRPESILEAEYFAPGNPYFKSKMNSSLLYSITLIRIISRIVQSINPARFGWPLRYVNYPAWYDSSAGPTQEKVEILNYILNRFGDQCSKQRKQCMLLLVPDGELFYTALHTGHHEFAVMRPQMPKNIRFVDLTDGLLSAFRNRYCDYLTQPKLCQGHFSGAGNLEIAKIVRRSLQNGNPPL